jgi:mRNA interferase MazF
LKRGEIWTASGAGGYGGKPRPVVIIQDDRFSETASITVCAFTTSTTDAPLLRLLISPTEHNGLRTPCRLMIDKIITIPKSRLGKRVGRLDNTDMVRFNRAALVFLGIAGNGAHA